MNPMVGYKNMANTKAQSMMKTQAQLHLNCSYSQIYIKKQLWIKKTVLTCQLSVAWFSNTGCTKNG